MVNFFQRLLFGPTGGALPLAAASSTLVPVSPWSGGGESSIARLVYADFYGASTDAVTRDTAMTVAPIKRGRAIIVGSLADLPLECGAFAGDWTPAKRQPAWLTTTHTVQTPWHRLAWTIDDLIFYGWSLWVLDRSESGAILDAARVAQDRWSFDANTPLGIKVNDQPVTDPKSVVLFQGPDEGVLIAGRETIRGWRAMEQSWVGRVRNPLPVSILHEVERNGVTPEEAADYVLQWSALRSSPDGVVGFLPAQLNFETYGEISPDLYIEARNAARLDVANLLNLPASLLDGSTATASLTYVTQAGDRQALVDYLEFWLAPIEARLSQDDVTPRGQIIRFNRSTLTATPNDSHGPELPSGTDEGDTDPTPALEASS